MEPTHSFVLLVFIVASLARDRIPFVQVVMG